jgi:hypothetical protein
MHVLVCVCGFVIFIYKKCKTPQSYIHTYIHTHTHTHTHEQIALQEQLASPSNIQTTDQHFANAPTPTSTESQQHQPGQNHSQQPSSGRSKTEFDQSNIPHTATGQTVLAQRGVPCHSEDFDPANVGANAPVDAATALQPGSEIKTADGHSAPQTQTQTQTGVYYGVNGVPIRQEGVPFPGSGVPPQNGVAFISVNGNGQTNVHAPISDSVKNSLYSHNDVPGVTRIRMPGKPGQMHYPGPGKDSDRDPGAPSGANKRNETSSRQTDGSEGISKRCCVCS